MSNKPAILGVALAFGASLFIGVPQPAVAQDKGPIKVGILLPLSGGGARIGKENLQGTQYAIHEAGGEINGRKIELVLGDDQMNPNTALNEARRLVEQEKVVAITGTLSSAAALAVHPYTTKAKAIYLTSGITTSLTQSNRSDYTFRNSMASGQLERPLAEFLYKDRGYRKGVLAGSDYAAGHDAVREVGTQFKALGGTVVREVFPRLGETDYVPFLSRFAGDKTDFVFGMFFGGDTLRFVRQYRELGLKFPLDITTSALSAASVWKVLGPNMKGLLSAELWVWTIDTPESKAFVDGYTKLHGAPPQALSYNGYIQGRVLVEALKSLGGNVENSDQLVAALRKVDFVGPAGRFRFDKHNNSIVSVFFVEWDYKDGQAVPVVQKTLENVDQYWQAK